MDQNDEGAILGAGQLVMDLALGEGDEASRRPRPCLVVEITALGFKSQRQGDDHGHDQDHTTDEAPFQSCCHSWIVACGIGARPSLVIVFEPLESWVLRSPHICRSEVKTLFHVVCASVWHTKIRGPSSRLW